MAARQSHCRSVIVWPVLAHILEQVVERDTCDPSRAEALLERSSERVVDGL